MHAHNEGDDASLKRAAERGAWVEFDGIGPDSVDRHVQLVKMMADAGHLGRVLVSHDAGWYHVGEEGGGTFRPFDTVFRRFVPAIKEALNEAAVTQLLVTNPAVGAAHAALTVSRGAGYRCAAWTGRQRCPILAGSAARGLFLAEGRLVLERILAGAAGGAAGNRRGAGHAARRPPRSISRPASAIA